MFGFLKSRLTRARESYETKLIEARVNLLETTTAYWDQYIDPRQAFVDESGMEWVPLGSAGQDPMRAKNKLGSPQALDAVRVKTRALASENEFAINGHENRISYVVGTGLVYELEEPEGVTIPEGVLQQAKDYLDAVLKANAWATREQEAVKRADRDGEVFIRTFWPMDGDGDGPPLPAYRFIEPEDVVTPDNRASDLTATWGVQTAEGDVEDVLGYYLKAPKPGAAGDFVEADSVLHVKLNVDSNQKRGIPTFYPVTSNLIRAEKLLRNMSAVATLQAAIALIREHDGFSKDQVETFRDDKDDFRIANNTTGKTSHFTQFGPGSIIDAPAGTKYQFPIAGVAAEKFVIVLQAELRAVASRLVMPEFMFTADASNANYASTMVAEGPAVKMFQRLQSFWREHFVSLLWESIETAVRIGVLPREVLNLVLKATLPSLTVRDEEKEGKTLGRESEMGVLSKQTWSEIRGYDFDQEQARLDEEREHAMESMPALTLPGSFGGDDDDAGDDDDDAGTGEE